MQKIKGPMECRAQSLQRWGRPVESRTIDLKDMPSQAEPRNLRPTIWVVLSIRAP